MFLSSFLIENVDLSNEPYWSSWNQFEIEAGAWIERSPQLQLAICKCRRSADGRFGRSKAKFSVEKLFGRHLLMTMKVKRSKKKQKKTKKTHKTKAKRQPFHVDIATVDCEFSAFCRPLLNRQCSADGTRSRVDPTMADWKSPSFLNYTVRLVDGSLAFLLFSLFGCYPSVEIWHLSADLTHLRRWHSYGRVHNLPRLWSTCKSTSQSANSIEPFFSFFLKIKLNFFFQFLKLLPYVILWYCSTWRTEHWETTPLWRHGVTIPHFPLLLLHREIIQIEWNKMK